MKEALSPGTTFSHYRILAQIGAGGMGEVYLAQDTRLERKVALKLLSPAFTRDRERLRRFEREARLVSKLNHPNILTIYEVGADGETPFIASEFIDGQTLRERLRGGRPAPDEALDFAIQIATALSAAHEAGVIHRDVKPENVMLRPDGYVKVLDFGLAKLTDHQGSAGADTDEATLQKVTTEAGRVLGTPQYMSPEQVRGQKADARSDVFSLGVMLHEMLTGRPPFGGINAIEVMASILDREPAPLKQHVAAMPDELQRIVGRALRKDREERYQTAEDLLNDLKDLKEELAFTDKLGRAGRAEGDEFRTVPADAVPTDAGTALPTTSSAPPAFRGIKRRKLAVLIALLVLVPAAGGIGLYWNTKNTDVAIDSIAVLPFANQSRAEETDYLADGLTESIINNLTQFPNLRVIARNSVFRYKGKEADLIGAGHALGARAVVVGRVLQRGESLMVSAELVDVRENKQLWGQQYNRQMADVFAVQEEMAKEISEKLRLKLTGPERQQLARRPTENLKAFQYYAQGRAYFQRRTHEDHLAAVRYFEKAIEEDHNYALAYAGLAVANASLVGYGYLAPGEGRRRAEEAARKAIALDDKLAEAHAALGVVCTVYAPSDFLQGDRELRRAIELSPGAAMIHQYLGTSLVQQGRHDEALGEYLKARELDPLSSVTARQVAAPYYFKRDYAQSLERLRQANELGPAFSTTWEIGVYIQNRLFSETLAGLNQAKRERKGDPILIYSAGMIYAARAERAEALRIIKELEIMSGTSFSQAHWIAKIYATLKEKEMAISWLERGLEAGAIGFFYKDEPVWDPIRDDARFSDLLRRMGVPQ
jgi:TolB-like protein/Tfp pilus assembly protein PilF